MIKYRHRGIPVKKRLRYPFSIFTCFIFLFLLSTLSCGKKDIPGEPANTEINPVFGDTSKKDFFTVVYKDSVSPELKADIFIPKNFNSGEKLPVLITFHGGAWIGGTPAYMHNQCWIFSQKGFLSIAPWYRVKNSHGTTPLECMIDAKSIIRWVIKNAEALHADTSRIILSGASAGGHLAAASAIIPEFSDDMEYPGITYSPRALILYCPAIDTNNGYFISLLKNPKKAIAASPYHNIRKNLPPTLVFHGDIDDLVPYAQSVSFTEKMNKFGNKCILSTMPGHGHNMHDNDFTDTAETSFKFLRDEGVIE